MLISKSFSYATFVASALVPWAVMSAAAPGPRASPAAVAAPVPAAVAAPAAKPPKSAYANTGETTVAVDAGQPPSRGDCLLQCHGRDRKLVRCPPLYVSWVILSFRASAAASKIKVKKLRNMSTRMA
jgi:hypothetical protein